MPVEALVRYQPMSGRGLCNKCGASIAPRELYFFVNHPGLMVRVLCEKCPPSGEAYAREHYRKASVQAGARAARCGKREARDTREDGLPRQDVPAAGRQADAGGVQGAGRETKTNAALHSLTTAISGLLGRGAR